MIKGNLATIGQSFLNQISEFEGIDFASMIWEPSNNSTHDASDPSTYEQVTFTNDATKYYSGLYDPNSNLAIPSFTIEKADLSLLFATFIWNLPSDTIAAGKNDAYMTFIKRRAGLSDKVIYRFHETLVTDNRLHSTSIIVPFTNMENDTIVFNKQKGISITNLQFTCLNFQFPLKN
jgi:hypothetical protein